MLTLSMVKLVATLRIRRTVAIWPMSSRRGLCRPSPQAELGVRLPSSILAKAFKGTCNKATTVTVQQKKTLLRPLTMNQVKKDRNKRDRDVMSNALNSLTNPEIEVIAANPKQVAQYLGGKKTVAAFFVGNVMRLSKGQANPTLLNELVTRKLDSLGGAS